MTDTHEHETPKRAVELRFELIDAWEVWDCEVSEGTSNEDILAQVRTGELNFHGTMGNPDVALVSIGDAGMRLVAIDGVEVME